jgi:hypothetical protein
MAGVACHEMDFTSAINLRDKSFDVVMMARARALPIGSSDFIYHSARKAMAGSTLVARRAGM